MIQRGHHAAPRTRIASCPNVRARGGGAYQPTSILASCSYLDLVEACGIRGLGLESISAATNGIPDRNIQVAGRLRHRVLSASAHRRLFLFLLIATHLIHWEPSFEISLFSPLPVRSLFTSAALPALAQPMSQRFPLLTFRVSRTLKPKYGRFRSWPVEHSPDVFRLQPRSCPQLEEMVRRCGLARALGRRPRRTRPRVRRDEKQD